MHSLFRLILVIGLATLCVSFEAEEDNFDTSSTPTSDAAEEVKDYCDWNQNSEGTCAVWIADNFAEIEFKLNFTNNRFLIGETQLRVGSEGLVKQLKFVPVDSFLVCGSTALCKICAALVRFPRSLHATVFEGYFDVSALCDNDKLTYREKSVPIYIRVASDEY